MELVSDAIAGPEAPQAPRVFARPAAATEGEENSGLNNDFVFTVGDIVGPLGGTIKVHGPIYRYMRSFFRFLGTGRCLVGLKDRANSSDVPDWASRPGEFIRPDEAGRAAGRSVPGAGTSFLYEFEFAQEAKCIF